MLIFLITVDIEEIKLGLSTDDLTGILKNENSLKIFFNNNNIYYLYCAFSTKIIKCALQTFQ